MNTKHIFTVSEQYHYLYGPVYSWRLGRSLGIDPLSLQEKICNFDCLYCQLGKTPHLSNQRKVFVKTQDLIKEIRTLPQGIKIDYFTFSGRGEPTLAKNLGEMIQALRKERAEKIAVITNSSLLNQKDVREDLSLADYVLAKLDSCSQETLETIDQTYKGIRFQEIIEGLMSFKGTFVGKLALQIMFVQQNKPYARQLAQIASLIGADEIQINTPLRPCGVSPLPREDIEEIKGCFDDLPMTSVYDAPLGDIESFNFKETVKRHGEF